MATARQLIVQQATKLAQQINGKPSCGYIMGATGWICTQARIEAQAKQYPEYAEAIFLHGPKWLGKPCYDCAQLTRTCARVAGYALVSGATSQWQRTMWEARGPISTLPTNSAGLMLFKETSPGSNQMSHTAVCIGDGTEVEALGHASGVVRRSMIGRTFTHWAALPNLDVEKGGTTPVPNTGTTVTVDTSPPTGTGGKLNIRDSASSSARVVAQVPNGSYLTVLSRGDTWSQVTNGYTMTKFLRFPGDPPTVSWSTDQVREIQTLLIAHGRTLPKFGVDGKLGTETTNAIKQFQGLNALPVTGVVDQATLELLRRRPEVDPPQDTLYRVIVPNLTLVQAEVMVTNYPGARKEIM